MECRWERDPRRPAVAGLNRAVLGGDRHGGGEGNKGDQPALRRDPPKRPRRRIEKTELPPFYENAPAP